MSKFIEQVKAEITIPQRLRHRVGPINDLFVEEKYKSNPGYGYYRDDTDTEYRIGVRWEKTVFAQPRDIPVLKEAIIHELRHDMYGEFIRDLIGASYQIKSRNYEKANELIEKVLKEVMGA